MLFESQVKVALRRNLESLSHRGVSLLFCMVDGNPEHAWGLSEDGLVKDLVVCRCWQCIYSTHCRCIVMFLDPALAQSSTAVPWISVNLQKRYISLGRTCPKLIKILPIISLASCHPNMTRLLWVLGLARAATTCCSLYKRHMPWERPRKTSEQSS